MQGSQAKQYSCAQIVEVPLSTMLDVRMVNALEDLGTFASNEANWVSRPFRILTATPSDSDAAPKRGGGDENLVKVPGSLAEPTAAQVMAGNYSKSGVVGKGERVLTLVGFEAISRLRHLLMIARESWAIRTAAADAVHIPTAVQLLTSTLGAAKTYLAGIHQAMTGCLRNQVHATARLSTKKCCRQAFTFRRLR